MRKQTAFWTIKNGRKVRICDMTDEHLLNAIRLCRRKGELIRDTGVILGHHALSVLNGEMAQMICEQEIESLEDTAVDDFVISLLPIFEKLLLEAERRKLPTE